MLFDNNIHASNLQVSVTMIFTMYIIMNILYGTVHRLYDVV